MKRIQDNTSLQAKLGNIGFHVLEAPQRDFKAIDGSVVMGRHELTYDWIHGTTLSDIEFCIGFLCEKESSGTGVVAFRSPQDLGEGGSSLLSESVNTSSTPMFPTPPNVTNPTADTPSWKKPKTEQNVGD